MTNRPEYFERVRKKAEQRWDQLEHDPELAGPWLQLFHQVQNPRHVVSELLQNADDAGATTAAVEIKDGEFVFSHDGEDFTEDHFTSLCRFGYSNKRNMRTIGFRGIGFKSTFSLGDEVRLITPTLSVAFGRRRFTEPVWVEHGRPNSSRTEVRVSIKDEYRQRELQKNLQEWISSPTSLLFFRSIRRLRINHEEVHWESLGPGPVDDSERMESSESPGTEYLVLRSSAEPFPVDAQQEIRDERMVRDDSSLDLPPCQVELVLGLEGRLFVILPTGVTTPLPFACNAPFIQDPARLQIKDPATSPTNRWLLRRIGQLAGTAMLAWLGRKKISIEQRCKAYRLLSNVDWGASSLEGGCATTVETALRETIAQEPFLITEGGDLRSWEGCVEVPTPLVDVWSEQQIAVLLGVDQKPILSRHVHEDDVKKLNNWGCLRRFERFEVLKALKAKDVARPKAWSQLLNLWNYVSNDVIQNQQFYRDLRIFPVKGNNLLYAADAVIRVAEKKLLSSPEDWEFLAAYMLVLDQNWPRYLAKQRLEAETEEDDPLGKQVVAANEIFRALGRDEASDVSQLIEQASSKFFSQDNKCGLEDCIRIAQIAAALGAPVPDSFQFVTRKVDGKLFRKPVNNPVVADVGNDFSNFVKAGWYDDHVLHEDYSRSFKSCKETEWRDWIASDRSKLLAFVPFVQKTTEEHKATARYSDRSKIKELLKERGAEREPTFPNVYSKFHCTDWDFEEAHWEHWNLLAQEDDKFWGHLLTRILAQPHRYWSKSISCEVRLVSNHGKPYSITHEQMFAAWIARFRKLPCLEDTQGQFRRPSDLLLRTAENESLLSVEPFVRKDFDTKENRPLLQALGVRSKAAGADRLIDRLRAFAVIPNPSVGEAQKLYQVLDQILSEGSANDLQKVQDAFAEEKLILTAKEEWACSPEVFLGANEIEVPGAAVVHPSVRHLRMWSKIGVAPQPTVELVLKWLKSLDSGQSLAANDLRRVRSMLPKYPDRIWTECSHWLNLEGGWAPVYSLRYALTDDSFPWKDLHSPVKQKTADLSNLSVETRARSPFSDLPRLTDCVEDRVANLPKRMPNSEIKPWLAALGAGLRRILRANQEDRDRVRELGNQLAVTAWQVVPEIEIIPFIDGQRAGNPRPIEAFWSDAVLYVADRAAAKLPKPIAGLLGRGFGADILEAINFCYDREPAKVMVYLEANFSLAPREETEPEPEDFDAANSDDNSDEADLDTSLTGSAGLATVDDATASLLGPDATAPTPLPDELNRPDRLTSSRTGSRTGTRGASPTSGDDVGNGRNRTGGGSAGSGESQRNSGRRGYTRRRSYVMHDRPDDDSPPDEKGNARRLETAQAGVKKVMQHESDNGRQPHEMPPNHEGYDVESSNRSGEIERYIEVKSLSDDWDFDDVEMTEPEFTKATKLGDRYWLYVVERAQQDDFQLHCIQDPAGKTDRFVFDSGWRPVAEETSDEVADVGRHPQEG